VSSSRYRERLREVIAGMNLKDMQLIVDLAFEIQQTLRQMDITLRRTLPQSVNPSRPEDLLALLLQSSLRQTQSPQSEELSPEEEEKRIQRIQELLEKLRSSSVDSPQK